MEQKNGPSGLRNTIGLIVLGALLFVVVPLVAWEKHSVRRSVESYLGMTLDRNHHFYDYAGIMPAWDTEKFEEYLWLIQSESDIDLCIVIVKDLGGRSIEEVAVEKVEALGVGGRTREERGVLLLYDLTGKRLRIEVGYGLEGFFPDAFVSYLIEDHTRAFFAAKDVSVGLRLLLRLLHYRIRQAQLGYEFDPTVVNVIRSQGHLSGGAGASVLMPLGQERQLFLFRTGSAEEKEYYSAQPTPEATFEKYREWLIAGQYNPALPIFTKNTQGFLVTLQMTKAYLKMILMQEYGKRYKVETRDNVAMLYFTDDPMVSPHLLVKGDQGWQLDIVAEVADTAEHTGLVYTWCYRGRGDMYTQAFADKLVVLKGCTRIADGDNRELPIRDKSR